MPATPQRRGGGLGGGGLEPHAAETIIRSLAAAIAKQDTINTDLRTCIEEQREFNRQQGAINERLAAAIERLDVTQARIETLIARLLPQSENGREAQRGKERQRMTEQNQARDLLATLRDALQKLDVHLGLTRDGVDEIATQVERLQAGVEALCDLRQCEATAVGIDMLVDAAADFLAAFRELESGILDAQAEVDMLEAEVADDEDGREP